jgi:hypothetical protein
MRFQDEIGLKSNSAFFFNIKTVLRENYKKSINKDQSFKAPNLSSKATTFYKVNCTHLPYSA